LVKTITNSKAIYNFIKSGEANYASLFFFKNIALIIRTRLILAIIEEQSYILTRVLNIIVETNANQN